MDFSFTEEQVMLQDTVRRFMQDGYGFEAYLASVGGPAGSTASIWQQFAELGWLAMPFPEEDEGLGGGPTELLLMAEQFGRGLCVEPYMANIVLSGQLLARQASAEQRQALLPSLLAGKTQISLAHAELAGRYTLQYCATRFQSGRLSGTKSLVLNAPNAEQFIVLARHQGEVDSRDGLGLYLVQAADVTLRPYAVLGGGVAAELELNDTPAVALGDPQSAFANLCDVIDLATAYSCAEAYGAMQALLEKTTEYLKTRKQFKKPLASFQVLQHRLVDMFVEVQQTQSMVLMSMLKLQGNDPAERARAVSACKAYVHKASKFVAQNAVQLHGGIGVTEELDIGHYFRRLTAFGALFGDREHHLRRFATLSQQNESSKPASLENAA